MEIKVGALFATSFKAREVARRGKQRLYQRERGVLDVASNVSTEEELRCFQYLPGALALQSFQEHLLSEGFVISQKIEERIVHFG
jgi:hypothetical protein